MRRALWMLSAPVVAGGLAWAVNAADELGTKSARAPAAQTGKVFYFSRTGKAGTESAAAARDASAADEEADAESASESTVPPRYTRSRAGATPGATGARPKNLYQDLFGEGTAE